MSAKIKCVEGNVLSVAIPLTRRVATLVDGSVTTVEEDFYPVGDVTVHLLSGWTSLTMPNDLTGNLLTFRDPGTVPVGCYAIEILCHDDQGEPCRFYMDCAVEIVMATADAGIVAGIEFDGETQVLDGALFVFAKGDKGDKGDDGVGISSITYKSSVEEGNVYTVSMTDGGEYDIVAPKGPKGEDADMSIVYTKEESDARYQRKEAGKGLSTNDYTNAEKQKLAGLENYDDTSIRWLIRNVQSSLTNYYTKSETYSRSQIDSMLESIQNVEIISVSFLPLPSQRTMGKIYLVPSSSPSGDNVKDEYITIYYNSFYKWEKIGSTNIDLDGYLKTTDVASVAISGSYNDLSEKPNIPAAQVQSDWNQTNTGEVDYIKNKPTNVSSFTNDAGYLTEHQSLTDYVQKSQTAGLLKNDGTVDTNSYATEAWVQQQGYLTQHQDISGKEDKVAVVSASGTALAAEVGKYYKFNSAVGTLAVALPSVTDLTKVGAVVFGFTTGSSPAVTFTPPSGVPIFFSDGFSIESSSSYEVNALFNGTAWCLALIKLIESV